MKLKLDALKISGLLSRDQMKTVMAGYGGSGGCASHCSNNSTYGCYSGSSGNCQCMFGGSCSL